MATTSTDYSSAPLHAAVVPVAVPPLASGDRLTADEFLRRYEQMPTDAKAELIDGVVYMFMYVSTDHSEPHAALVTLLGYYHANTKGVLVGDNGTLRLDLKNVPQPDVYLRIAAEAGGQAKVVDKYVVGAPELVAEVAASSASYDLHDKLEAYQRSGVKEYLVWRVWDQAIDWFVLGGDTFQPLPPDRDGIHRSRVFPGLWIDTAAILAGDLAKALAVVQQGLACEAHQAFSAELKRKLDAGTA